MTGFGKGIAENQLGTARIEIKSLNCKFFEVISKLPPNLTIFEDRIRELLQKKVLRGRLTLFLNYDSRVSKGDEVHIDKKIAKHYYTGINTLKKFLGIKGSVGIEQIIALPGVIAYHPREDDAKKLWPLVSKALVSAVDDLTRSRAREGKMLNKNIRQIVKMIETALNKIKKRAPLVACDYKKRLLKNVKKLTGTTKIHNPERIEEEAAIFARNCDITEEMHRVCAHISGFRKILSNSGETGRRLDFVAQEMYREANTIGAKANDFSIAKEVIKIKSHIEKIREQVQNVE
jgi:uncharacterized protein (TIGR00255 family)